MASFLNRIGLGKNTISKYLENKFEYKNLTYPMDLTNIGTQSNHAIIFHIWQRAGTKYSVDYTDVNGETRNTSLARDSNGNPITRSPSANFDPRGILNNIDSQLGNNLPDYTLPDYVKNAVGTVSLLKQSIVLYIPSKVVTRYNMDWSEVELRNEETLTSLLGPGSMSEKLKTLTTMGIEGFARNASSVTKINLIDLLSISTGIAANPHLETLFRGVPFRNFDFSFKMSPRNEKEANVIANIEKTFRFYMSPEVIDGSGGRFLRFPSEFSIEFISYGKPNAFMNKIGNCVLTSMSVDRTGAGVSSFHRHTQRNDIVSNNEVQNANDSGAPPTVTQLDLSFREVEIVTKEKVKEYNY